MFKVDLLAIHPEQYKRRLEVFNRKLGDLESLFNTISEKKSYKENIYLSALISGLRKQYNFQQTTEFQNIVALNDYIAIIETLLEILKDQQFRGDQAEIEKRIAVEVWEKRKKTQEELTPGSSQSGYLNALVTGGGVGFALGLGYSIAFTAVNLIALGIVVAWTATGACAPCLAVYLIHKATEHFEKKQIISSILEPLEIQGQNVFNPQKAYPVAFAQLNKSADLFMQLCDELNLFQQELTGSFFSELNDPGQQQLKAIYEGLKSTHDEQIRGLLLNLNRPVDPEYIKCCISIAKHFRAEARDLNRNPKREFSLDHSLRKLNVAFHREGRCARIRRDALKGILIAAVISIALIPLTGGGSALLYAGFLLVGFAFALLGVAVGSCRSMAPQNRDDQQREGRASNAQILSKKWADINRSEQPSTIELHKPSTANSPINIHPEFSACRTISIS